jgi:flagellar hook-length control protein FliK
VAVNAIASGSASVRAATTANGDAIDTRASGSANAAVTVTATPPHAAAPDAPLASDVMPAERQAQAVVLPPVRQDDVAGATDAGSTGRDGGDGASSAVAVQSDAATRAGTTSASNATASSSSSATGAVAGESTTAVQTAVPSGQQSVAQPTSVAAPVAPAATSEASAPAPAAGEVSPEVDLHDQVVPVIVRQARLVSAGSSHELTVRLDPDHLGPLHVRISLVEGALSVGLTAANADAQRALETALPQLRGALADSGLRLDRLDVALRDGGNGSNGSDAGGQRGFGRGGDGRQGSGGDAPRQFDGRQDSGPSFADVLFDQDGRAFRASGSAGRSANRYGYRAYRRG